jgi:hypothetical protein
MIRTHVPGILAILLIVPPATLSAAEAPLRSYTVPPGHDDNRPMPRAAPAVVVEQRLLAPPGPTDQPAVDSVFGRACSAAEAATVTEKPPKTVRCAAPFIVLPEFP